MKGQTLHTRIMSRLDLLRAYYASCGSGDAARVAAHFTEDAVHWFTRLPPLHGSRAIGEHTALAVQQLGARWELEHGVEQGDEAVTEWAMHWTDPRSGDERVTRGSEWFVFDADRIREVRAYYHSAGLVGRE